MGKIRIFNENSSVYINSRAFQPGTITASNNSGYITIKRNHNNRVIVNPVRYDQLEDKDGNAWGSDGPTTVTALNNYINTSNPDGLIKSTDKITDLTGITASDFASKPGYTVFVGSTDGSLQTSDALLLSGSDVRVKGAFLSAAGTNIALTPGSNGKVRIHDAYNLPASDGTSGQVVQTDGAGNLSFATVSGGGGGSSPWTTSGSDIYYTTGNVGVGTTTPSQPLHVDGNAKVDGQLIIQDGTFSHIVIGNGALPTSASPSYGGVIIGSSAARFGHRYQNVIIGQNAGYLGLSQSDKNISIGADSLKSGQARSNNVAIGHAAMSGASTTTASNTVAVGYEALTALTTGANNTAVGYQAGDAVTTGSTNTLVGNSAGTSLTTGYENVFVGYNTGTTATTTLQNTFVGTSAGKTGSGSVGVGYNALQAATGNYNAAVGYRALRWTTGANNTALGYQAAQGTSAPSTFANTVAVGYQALTALTTGSSNTAVGYQASKALTTSIETTNIGYQAGLSGTSGASYNTYIGHQSGMAGSSAQSNTMVGHKAGTTNSTGDNNASLGAGSSLYLLSGGGNVAIGAAAMRGNSTGSDNVMIGHQSGRNATGSSNVFIGHDSGYNETGDNKLYIENSSSTTPLIYGEFDNDILRVNGTLQVNDPASTGYAFPAATGTLGQVLEVDANGDLTFATPSGGGGGGGLGGADQTLTADRTIDTNGFNLDIELDPTGTPDTFTIHDGTHDLFQVDTSTSGDIFSVNDVSGLPEITVNTTNGVDIPNLNFYKGCISGKGGQTSQATYGTQWRSSMSGQSLGRYQTSSNNSLLTFASGTPSVGDTLSANNYAIATAYLLPGINFSKINLRGNIRAYDANAEGETQHMEVWTFDQTDISGFGTTTCTFRGKVSYTFDSTSATIKPILINSDISYSGDKDTGILIVGHAPTNPSASYNTAFMVEVTVT